MGDLRDFRERAVGTTSPGPDISVGVHAQHGWEHLVFQDEALHVWASRPSQPDGCDLYLWCSGSSNHLGADRRTDSRPVGSNAAVRLSTSADAERAAPLPPLHSSPFQRPNVAELDMTIATTMFNAPCGPFAYWESFVDGRVIDRGFGEIGDDATVLIEADYSTYLQRLTGAASVFDLIGSGRIRCDPAMIDAAAGVALFGDLAAGEEQTALFQAVAGYLEHLRSDEYKLRVAGPYNRSVRG